MKPFHRTFQNRFPPPGKRTLPVHNSIAMPDKVWPFRTTAMVTIDRAMDMQHTMFELAQLTNDYYRLQLLLVILTAFMMIVFDCHGLLDLLSNRTKSEFCERVQKTRNYISVLTRIPGHPAGGIAAPLLSDPGERLLYARTRCGV